MIVVSLDLETTGLDPIADQVLQIGAIAYSVAADHELSTFEAVVPHMRLAGSPFALNLNQRIIERIVRGGLPDATPNAVWDRFRSWLEPYRTGPSRKIVAAGKNVAGFDLPFIRAAAPEVAKLFMHRVLDPAALWIEALDDVPPDLSACLRRAGLPDSVTHDAVDDARQVLQVLRAGWARRLSITRQAA